MSNDIDQENNNRSTLQHENSKNLFLIDGLNYIYRVFYGLPPMNNKYGNPVNAVFGFTSLVMKII